MLTSHKIATLSKAEKLERITKLKAERKELMLKSDQIVAAGGVLSAVDPLVQRIKRLNASIKVLR